MPEVRENDELYPYVSGEVFPIYSRRLGMSLRSLEQTEGREVSYRYRHGMNWIRQEKRLAIYMRDNFACIYCGIGIEEEVIFTLDHVHHRGGNEASNLVTACADCNTLKERSAVGDFLVEKYEPEKAARVLAHVRRALETDVKPFLPEAKRILKARREKGPF